MRYRLQRHDGIDCSATMVPITVLRMVPIQRYRHNFFVQKEFVQIIKKHADVLSNSWASFLEFMLMFFLVCSDS